MKNWNRIRANEYRNTSHFNLHDKWFSVDLEMRLIVWRAMSDDTMEIKCCILALRVPLIEMVHTTFTHWLIFLNSNYPLILTFCVCFFFCLFLSLSSLISFHLKNIRTCDTTSESIFMLFCLDFNSHEFAQTKTRFYFILVRSSFLFFLHS